MDANPITARRRRTGTRVLAAAGLAALAIGAARTAPGQTPAATLKAPQPLEPLVWRLVARGASPSPSFAAFETPRPAPPVTLSPSGRSPGWLTGPSPIPPPSSVHTPPSLTPVSAASRVEPKKQSYMGRKWDDVKEFFGGPPPVVPPVPAPRVTHPGPAAAAARAVPPAAGPAAPTATGGVYAGPPAYRWYGWGTTTPGANPYAPTGQSPRGSATWYAQSGATPGAFPVPVMNPTRPEPGAESPAYTTAGGAFARQEPLVRPASGRTVVPVPPAASAPLPVRERVIAPVPVFHPIPTMAYPPLPVTDPGVTVPVPPRATVPQATSSADHWTPIAQTAPGGGVMQAAAVSPPREDATVRTLSLTPAPPHQPDQSAPRLPVAGLTWRSVRDEGDVRFASAGDAGLVQNPSAATSPADPRGRWGAVRKPADADARLAAPPWVTRGQQPPAADGPSLDNGIRNACYGRAIVTEVRHTGPSSVLIRLTAPSDDDGQSAARAVSRLPQLLDYDVRFELTLSRR